MMTSKQYELWGQFAEDLEKALERERNEQDEEQFLLEQAGTAVDYS